MDKHECDVLVVGSGAGGFAAAITAIKAGLDVLVTEKASVFGGTTATSGGYLWIPDNPLAARENLGDSPERATDYLRQLCGEDFDPVMVAAYLSNGPAMVDFFTSTVGISFSATTRMIDYHPEFPGGQKMGRSIQASPVHASILGEEFARLRPLPRELALFGMGVSSGSDLRHLYKFGRSLQSTLRVSALLTKYGWDRLIHGRGRSLVNGNALVAQLAGAYFASGGRLWTLAPAMDLRIEAGRVVGAVVHRRGNLIEVRARRGVVLASGGFSHDVERRRKVFRHPAGHEDHVSIVAPGNVGDGARMAESAGGYIDEVMSNPAAWMPISKVPRPDGSWGGIIHSVNQGKPGTIAVLRNGKRFTDESRSYHEFVESLIKHPDAGRPAGAFFICDHDAFSRYGLGYAKPFLPIGPLIQSGYITRAATISELGVQAGIDAGHLQATVEAYNAYAERGEDPEFGKGRNAYGAFLGDETNPFNANVAPLRRPPFYALWFFAGDVGTFAGIRIDANARVMRKDGSAVEGLYAAGNDAANVFRGHYPGAGSLIGPAMTFGFAAARHMSGMSHHGDAAVIDRTESDRSTLTSRACYR
ncbi:MULTISPECIES: FAD-binding protein [unclassified Chelatococcus]|uniref:FAD-binding protein n=1 Tax=unclassified Chelatococcus TaxID=2638111 RepID=UPI001BCC7658|nr:MULTISPECIES: FAD-binding protein [unclassified Chelatococcus]MBS7700628.1 FAD-dependent oxidoreductase [Chelatococcus sp. YT9]MBX3559059.1 FAD-dependent oxidoreductase [Chelatococcus sp.]